VIALADRARAATYRVAMRSEPLRAVLLHRQHRLELLALGSLVVSAVLALRQPVVSLFLGAAVLGVPHLLSGLRHTVLQRRLSPVTIGCAFAAVWIGIALVLGRGGDWAWPMLVAAFSLSAFWESGRSPLAALGFGVVAVAMSLAPGTSMLLVTHLHAVCSLVYLGRAGRLRGFGTWSLLVGFGVLSAVALTGALDGVMADEPWMPTRAYGAILAELQATAFGAGERWLQRAVFVYALGQALHYAVWLRLMPELDRPTPVPKPFRVQLAAWRADLGRWWWPSLALVVIAGLAMLLGQGAARQLYFTLSFFHVGLEAAALLALRPDAIVTSR
jgi:hypothetical protein